MNPENLRLLTVSGLSNAFYLSNVSCIIESSVHTHTFSPTDITLRGFTIRPDDVLSKPQPWSDNRKLAI